MRWALVVAASVAVAVPARADLARTEVRLGPSCPVRYADSVHAMAEALRPRLEASFRSRLGATARRLRSLRIPSGLEPATAAAHRETDLLGPLRGRVEGERLAAALASLSVYDLVFLGRDDDASRRLADHLAATDGPPLLVFVVDSTLPEIARYRATLPDRVRGAFPASRRWCSTLGIPAYPALARVREGRAVITIGPPGAEP